VPVVVAIAMVANIAISLSTPEPLAESLLLEHKDLSLPLKGGQSSTATSGKHVYTQAVSEQKRAAHGQVVGQLLIM